MLASATKTLNGVATLTRQKPEEVLYGFEPGPDSEDFRIIQTVVDGIPILNTYVPELDGPGLYRSRDHGHLVSAGSSPRSSRCTCS